MLCAETLQSMAAPNTRMTTTPPDHSRKSRRRRRRSCGIRFGCIRLNTRGKSLGRYLGKSLGRQLTGQIAAGRCIWQIAGSIAWLGSWSDSFGLGTVSYISHSLFVSLYVEFSLKDRGVRQKLYVIVYNERPSTPNFKIRGTSIRLNGVRK
jgi:hypothetical protein